MLAFRVCRVRAATLLEPDILRCLHSDSVHQTDAVRYMGYRTGSNRYGIGCLPVARTGTVG